MPTNSRPPFRGLVGEVNRMHKNWRHPGPGDLDREVRQSQRRRMAVREALATGTPAPWDFAPAYDASRRYIRNHMDLADLEEMARFPPAGRRTPSA